MSKKKLIAMAKGQHGGIREPGPGKTIGRKPFEPGMPKKQYGTRLPVRIVKWLQAQPNASEAIVAALIAHNNIAKD